MGILVKTNGALVNDIGSVLQDVLDFHAESSTTNLRSIEDTKVHLKLKYIPLTPQTF